MNRLLFALVFLIFPSVAHAAPDNVATANVWLCDHNLPSCNADIVVAPTYKPAPAQATIHGIQLDPKTLAWSPADLAIIITHEYQHVADFRAGVPYDCNSYEQRAVRAQLGVFNTEFPLLTGTGPGGTSSVYRDLDPHSEEEAMSATFAGGNSTTLIKLYWGC